MNDTLENIQNSMKDLKFSPDMQDKIMETLKIKKCLAIKNRESDLFKDSVFCDIRNKKTLIYSRDINYVFDDGSKLILSRDPIGPWACFHHKQPDGSVLTERF